MAKTILSKLKKTIADITSPNTMITETKMEENEVVEYVKKQLQRLSNSDTLRRRRYDYLLAFYSGQQWRDAWSAGDDIIRDMSDYGQNLPNARPEGSNQIVFNKIAPVCDKYVEFLSITQLNPHVPKKTVYLQEDQTPLDRAEQPSGEEVTSQQADTTEKIGRTIMFEDNDAREVLSRVAEQCSQIGDGWFRSVINPQTKKIQMESLNAYNLSAWWKDNTYSQLAGVIYTGEMDYEIIRRTPEQGGLNKDGILDDLTLDEFKKTIGEHYFRQLDDGVGLYYDVVIDLSSWDSKGNYIPKHRNFIIVGNRVVQDEIKEEPNPYYHVAFKKRPGEGWGETPAWQALNLQVQINIALSDEADIIGWFASPFIIDENSGQNPQDIIGGTGGPKIIPINEGGRMYFLEWSGRIYPVAEHINRLIKAFDDVTGMPAIAYGAIDASLATGVALTTSFQPTIQKIKRWTDNWNATLRQMWRDNLIRTISLDKSARDFIQDNFLVEWEWGERAPRDESLHQTNIINMKNASLMSDETAMSKLGIPSPIDEKVRIAHEKNNPYYNPELALTKLQAYSAYEQQRQQAVQQQQITEQGQQAPGTPSGEGGFPIPGNQGGPRTAMESTVPNLPPNLNNVPQPMAQPGVGGNSYQQPLPGQEG